MNATPAQPIAIRRERTVVGVLLAAGASRRMGSDKRVLPWPSQPVGTAPWRGTVVGAAFDAVAPCCDEMIVVAEPSELRGPAPRQAPGLALESGVESALESALGTRRYTCVSGIGGDSSGESLRAGLEHVRSARGGQWPDAIIVHLADHPAVRPSTVRTLLDHLWRDPSRVVTPCLAAVLAPPIGTPAPTADTAMTQTAAASSIGGHPIAIPQLLLDRVLAHLSAAASNSAGLRSLWQTHPELRCRVTVDDLGIVINLDTPDDYQRHIEHK